MSERTVRDAHDEAMAHAWDAMALREQARAESREAMDLELEALAILEAVGTGPETEPTRSILRRSAGWLAHHAGDSAKARELAVAILDDPQAHRSERADAKDLLDAVSPRDATIDDLIAEIGPSAMIHDDTIVADWLRSMKEDAA